MLIGGIYHRLGFSLHSHYMRFSKQSRWSPRKHSDKTAFHNMRRLTQWIFGFADNLKAKIKCWFQSTRITLQRRAGPPAQPAFPDFNHFIIKIRQLIIHCRPIFQRSIVVNQSNQINQVTEE